MGRDKQWRDGERAFLALKVAFGLTLLGLFAVFLSSLSRPRLQSVSYFVTSRLSLIY